MAELMLRKIFVSFIIFFMVFTLMSLVWKDFEEGYAGMITYTDDDNLSYFNNISALYNFSVESETELGEASKANEDMDDKLWRKGWKMLLGFPGQTVTILKGMRGELMRVLRIDSTAGQVIMDGFLAMFTLVILLSIISLIWRK